MYDLGLSTEQYLDSTPAQISALSKRAEVANHRFDYRNAVLCSLIGNMFVTDPSKKMDPEELAPWPDGEEPEEPAPPAALSPEQMAVKLKIAFAGRMRNG